eukprot:g5155.t1
MDDLDDGMEVKDAAAVANGGGDNASAAGASSSGGNDNDVEVQDLSTDTKDRTAPGTDISYQVFGNFLPQSVHFTSPAAQSAMTDQQKIAAFFGIPASMLKFTGIVTSGTKRQYMVELVHPDRWQGFLSTVSRKLDYSLENATLLLGKQDAVPRTMALPEIKVGGVPCTPGKWGWFVSAAGKDYMAKPETHLRLGKILRQLVTATTVKEYFRFAYSYHSQATQEVEISCASELYFFAWVPSGLAEALESKYANSAGEIKCDWDETFPKTADKLSVKVTKYIQRSHQQAALPSPTSTSSSSSSPAIGLGPSVVGTLASIASPPNLQQSLADKARYTTEIADLKAQLEAAKVDFKRRLDEANQQHASAVDLEKAAKVDFKRRLEEANQQHANAMIFQKQRGNGLVTELKGARTSFDKEVAKYKSELVSVRQVLETDQNEMAALKDELVAATDEVKSLKKTIAYKDRALRESKKKITDAKKTGAQEALEVVEERDELLAEVESEKVQASHHKERADKLAKELANAKRRVKRMELRLASVNDGGDTGKRRKGKRSRSDPESSDASATELISDQPSEPESSDEDKFTSPPAHRKEKKGKKRKRKKEKSNKKRKSKEYGKLKDLVYAALITFTWLS